MTRLDLGYDGGFALNVELAGAGPPVVLLHGFTGSAASWSGVAGALAGEFTTIAVDLVGHGHSDAPKTIERYRMDRCADDLVAVVGKLGYASATWLGYSLGARVALHVAVRRPQAVAALVLESASPGIADDAEREARRRADEELAQRIERGGVAAFVDYWEGVPLFASQRSLPGQVFEVQRRARLTNSAVGLANSLRGMGPGAHAPLHGALGHIGVPTLVLAGALDAKYRAIGEELAQALPRATLRVVPDAGHNTHLERPAAFTSEVLDFLRQAHRLPVRAGER